jgi:hypothetical protein
LERRGATRRPPTLLFDHQAATSGSLTQGVPNTLRNT